MHTFQMLKLLSMWKVDFWTAHSEMMKVVSKLVSLVMTLLIYINFSTCLLYYVADIDKKWIPPVDMSLSEPEEFYSLPKRSRYLATLYAAVLVLTGNEIEPRDDLQIAVASILTILGALIIANIFGTFAVVVTSLNRKNSKFQEKIDTANSSMLNMKIPELLQEEIR